MVRNYNFHFSQFAFHVTAYQTSISNLVSNSLMSLV